MESQKCDPVGDVWPEVLRKLETTGTTQVYEELKIDIPLKPEDMVKTKLFVQARDAKMLTRFRQTVSKSPQPTRLTGSSHSAI